MKKALSLLIFAGALFFCGNAQNIIQISNDGNRNNNSNQQQECPYRINGICASEDIGGVDFEINKCSSCTYSTLEFTNYNNFAVTVLYEIVYNTSNYNCSYQDRVETGSVVIPANGTKNKNVGGCLTGDWALKGMIVRKLKN